MSDIILPLGYEIEKKKNNPEGQGRIVGLTPWRDTFIHGRGVNGAARKKGNWKEYYDMYRQHAILHSAVEKIAKTATNVGFDFVPRDSRAQPKKSEIRILQEFFAKQPNFIGELRKIYKDLIICGDAYLYIVPDRLRRPQKLKRLHPRTMHIEMSKNGEVLHFYQKDPDAFNDNVVITFEPHEILHFKLDDPDNDIYGLSPLEALKWAVTADLYAQRYNAAFFQNSGVTGTIIGVRNANPDEVQRNRKWLEENYIGPQSAHKPIIIEGESISIDKSVATHTEMGFLDGRKFIILEILAVLDVPPAKVGIMESANRSNSKEQDKTFRTESVSPLQNLVQSVLNDDFIRPILGVQNTIFVHAEGDTRDAIEQMDYFTKGAAWGIFNINEIRSKLGMAPIEGGDINFIMAPTGVVPVDRMLAYFIPPQLPDGAIDSAEDPLSGEPPPKPTPNSKVSTGVSVETTKRIREGHFAEHLTKALTFIMDPYATERALRSAYCHLHEAIEGTHDIRVIEAHEALGKGLRTRDSILRDGYIDMAKEALAPFVRLPDHLTYLGQIAEAQRQSVFSLDDNEDEDDLEEVYRP